METVKRHDYSLFLFELVLEGADGVFDLVDLIHQTVLGIVPTQFQSTGSASPVLQSGLGKFEGCLLVSNRLLHTSDVLAHLSDLFLRLMVNTQIFGKINN